MVATGYNNYGQCDVASRSHIIAIETGDNHTLGLKKDGTVVAVGSNTDGQCDVSAWRDMTAVDAGSSFTVGLRQDGAVLAVGQKNQHQCDVHTWVIAFNTGETAIGGDEPWDSQVRLQMAQWANQVLEINSGETSIGEMNRGTTR